MKRKYIAYLLATTVSISIIQPVIVSANEMNDNAVFVHNEASIVEEDTSITKGNTTEEDTSITEESTIDEKNIGGNVNNIIGGTSTEEVLIQESREDVVEINNIDDLRNINNNLSGNYVLVKDINLNGEEVKIGSKDEPFTGTFDGDFGTISGLVSNGGTSIGNGLFVSTNGATIKNLKLKAPNVTGNYYTGALVGIAYNTNISSVTIEDPTVRSQGITTGVSLLDSASTYAGGVVGWSENTIIDIAHVVRPNILNTTDVAVDGLKYPTYYSGGITGRNIGGSISYAQVIEGTIKASHSSTVGLVSVTKMVAGGITGCSEGHIENVYVTSTIDTYGRLDIPLGGVEPTSGGIVGYFNDGSTIKSAVFKGIVNTETRYMGIGTHDKWTGGIVGYQAGGNLGDIQGAYYHNEISRPNDAWKQFGAVWDKDNTDQYGPIIDSNFGNTDLFLGFDFEKYWHVDRTTGHVMYGPGVGDGTDEDEIMPTQVPIIEGVEDVIIAKGSVFNAKDGVTAWDAEDGDITRYINIEGEVDTNVVDEYTLTYIVEDRDNNRSSVTRVVTVAGSIVTGVDTDGDGKPDINLDIDSDGILDINIDTDGDNIPDINIDINGDGIPDVNVDVDGDGKPDINISEMADEWRPELDVDINNNGEVDYDTDSNYPKPSVNVDIDGDGKPDINIDTNGDGIPDINIDTDGDQIPDINVDLDGDKTPNINIDTDRDGIPDINIDTNGDGIPDVNVDMDGDGVPDININNNIIGWNPDNNVDINGDGKVNYDTDATIKPEINVDIDGDQIPDINIDTNGDGIPDLNVDTDGDEIPDLNVDLDMDGTPDINMDTNGDRIPDINVDTNGDGQADTNIDTNNDNVADENIVTPPLEWNPGSNVDSNGDGKLNYDTDTNYKTSTPVEKSEVKAAYWKNDCMVIDGYNYIDGVELNNDNDGKVVRRAELIDESGNAIATAKVTSVNWETSNYSKELTGYQIMITKDEFANLTENASYKIKLITEYKDETYETIVKQKESSKVRMADWIDGYYREFDQLGTNVISNMVISTDVNSQLELIIRRELNDNVKLNITRNNINAKNQLVIDGEIQSSFDFNKKHQKYIAIKDSYGAEVYKNSISSFKDRNNSFQAIIPEEFVSETFIYEVQVNTGDVVILNKEIK